MTDNTIFDQEVNTPSDLDSNYDQLVGEGKKFKDNEALARGKVESDRFIQQLQREQAELRRELDSRLNMEELVKKLGSNAPSTPVTPTVPESHQTPTPTVMPTNLGLSQDDVASIVKNTMTQEQTKLQQEKNLNAVAGQLQKVWGDDWVSKLRAAGRSLDLTEAQMDVMAKTSPKALLQAVLPTQSKVDNVSPIRSTIMAIPQQAPDSGWSKYEKMRRENPRQYYSPSVQLQLERDVRSGKVTLPSE